MAKHLAHTKYRIGNYRAQTPIDHSVTIELERRVVEWNDQRTLESAQELVWAASVFGHAEMTAPSLSEISRRGDIPKDLQEVARDLLKGEEQGETELTFNLDSKKLLRENIRDLKLRITLAAHDPIQYVELARVYCRLGQTEQARRAFNIAYGLAPASRFILRAATRFLVHIQDYDRAITILSGGNSSDPWLQATKISVLDLSGRAVRDIKRIRALLETDTHPKHLSELAGSLATLELTSGNVSRAKKLFRQGAIEPNDNVVAQLHWASQKKIVEFRPELLKNSLRSRREHRLQEERKGGAKHFRTAWIGCRTNPCQQDRRRLEATSPLSYCKITTNPLRFANWGCFQIPTISCY